jgi:hypothetical protein
VPASGKKEGDAAGNMRPDLSPQRSKLLAEQFSGLKTKSMKNCVVMTSRSGAKAGKLASPSNWAASVSNCLTVSSPHQRAIP